MGALAHGLSESLRDQIEEVVGEYSCRIDLLQELAKGTDKTNKFDDDKWWSWSGYSRSHISIDFRELNELVNAKIIDDMKVSLAKCFCLDLLEQGYGVNVIRIKVSMLAELIKHTQDFDREIVENKEMMGLNEEIIIRAIKADISNYFSFLEYNDVLTNEQKIFWEGLEEQANRLEIPMHNARMLPPVEDVFKTGFYIQKFFDEDGDEDLKSYFYPVYIWWKITNVIPMRPTEFTHRLEKDCLIQEGGEYYLKVNRIKESNIKRKRKKAKVPLLDRYKISDEHTMIIKKYLEITKEDTQRKTFFSYETHRALGEKLKAKGYKVQQFMAEGTIDTFVLRDFAIILDAFYNVIIYERYKEMNISQRLRPGDTRHLAFCSLMLQGLTPVEIALMGGHRHLCSQNHYVGHSKYYISSEILKYLGRTTLTKNETEKTLKSIIYKKSEKPPRSLSESVRTDEGIGYCMAEADGTDNVCEHSKCCIFCSKWWCAPTDINYIKAKEYLDTNYIGSLQEMLQQEEEVLKKLLASRNVVTLGDLLEIDKSDSEEIRKQGKKIKACADEIVNIKTKLLNLSGGSQSTKREDLWLDQN